MRGRVALFITLIFLLPTVVAEAGDSVVEITQTTTIGDADLALEALAVSPDGENALVVGQAGFAHFFSATEPTDDVELNSGDDDLLRAVDWHPQGLTALMAGSDGTLLRFTLDDYSISHVAGSTGNLMGQELTAVTWDPSGNWAYIGGDNGLLMRFREDGNGNSEYLPLNGSLFSDITGISCHHQMHSVCIVATESDGLGLIDQDHEVTWLPGSRGTHWRAVECPHPSRERCFAVGSNQNVGVIEIYPNSPSNSYVSVKQVDVSFEFIGIHPRGDDNIILQTAPFGLMDWEIMSGEDKLGIAYPWLNNSDVIPADVSLGGASLIGGWSDESETGFVVTSYGAIAYYYPPENTLAENLVSAIAPMVVIIAVPGVVLGLIYIASPKLQKKYLEWSYSRREAKRQANSGKKKKK